MVFVSVAIPIFNAEKWILKTIESVLDQSYSNIEIVLVDDCSTDSSHDLIQYIAQTNPLVNIKIAKNYIRMGVCATRNRAVNLSEGKYILFLDADDLLRSDCIELLLRGFRPFHTKSAVKEFHVNQ